MITSGEGRYKVFLKKIKMGKDYIYLLGGGDESHIGGVVICEPNKKINTIRLEGHFDYIVLELIASELCKKYKKRIVITGGIHIEQASKKEINMIIENCRKLITCI